MKKITTLLILALGAASLHSQDRATATPQTALDFLTIPMDARAAALGDMGVGTTPDHYAHQYNPAKHLFGTSPQSSPQGREQREEAKAGAFLSYTPWARSLVEDMSLTHLGAFYRIDERQSFSASFRHFAMGDMDFSNDDGAPTSPGIAAYQLALDAAYARLLSPHIGFSVGFRYAVADLYPRDGYRKGQGVAADVAFYFHRPLQMGGVPSLFTLGASLTDIGTKIAFRDGAESYFMPLTFKLGAGLTGTFGENHKVMFAAELQRSMVPASEKDRERSSIGGFIASFGNGAAPGLGVGVEYGYRDFLFGRMGYHHESAAWSYRRYFTLGAGGAYKIIHLDIAYLVSTGIAHGAMDNTVRFSLAVDID
jgi:hypothetical protein